MKKALCVILSLILIISLVSFSRCDFVSAIHSGDIYSYLLIGLDNAGNNTDVLAIVSYNARHNHVSVIQIPRDTYYNFGFYQNKINQFCPKMISDGKTHEEAFSLLTERIEEVFKIHLKGYIALTTESFVRFVDGLGGIKIQIDEDFPYVEDFRKIGVNLVIGENVLLGNSALKFVRHRATYLGGDLTRLDVQKVFFSGMFETIYRFVTDEGVRRLYSNIKENVSSDFSIIDIILMVIKHSSKFKTVEFVYFTLPGKAYLSPEGIWYYQINKPGLREVRATYLNAEITFESDENLVISKEIYLNENIDYKVFYSKAVTENQEE